MQRSRFSMTASGSLFLEMHEGLSWNLWNPQWLRFGTEAIKMSSGFGSLVLAWTIPLGLPWGLNLLMRCRAWLPAVFQSPLLGRLLLCVWLALTLPTPCSPLSVYIRLSPAGLLQQAAPPVRPDRLLWAELCLCWVGVEGVLMGTARCCGAQGLGRADSAFLEVSNNWGWRRAIWEKKGKGKE